MVYPGFLRLGGVDVVNTERARGYMRTADCPSWMIQGRPCESLNGALFDDPYTYDNISLAPWYDASLPDVSGRFYGIVGLELQGINDSTRQASITQGVGPGGVIGRTRKGVKQTRVRATLLSQGDDAMDYGRSWLNSVFDGSCSEHGEGCGTMDMEFLTDCPPVRGTVPDFSEWGVEATNIATHGSFDVAGAAGEYRHQWMRDPAFTNMANWTFINATATSANGVLDVTIGASVPTSILLTPATTGWFTGTVDGVEYSAAYEVENTGTTPGSFRIGFYNGTAYTYGPGFTIAPGEKRRVTGTVARPAGSAYLQPRLHVVPGGFVSPGGRFLISEPMMETGSMVGPFFSGSVQPKVRRNLAPRPYPAAGNGWLTNNSALYTRTWDATGGRNGRGATLFTRQAATPQATIASVYAAGLSAWNIGGWVKVVPGEVWTVSAYSRSEQEIKANMTVNFFDAAGASLGAATIGALSGTIPIGEWGRAALTVTVPANAAYMGGGQNALLAIGLSIGGEKTWMTDALYEKTANLNTYFDGGMPIEGYVAFWDGVAGSSTSYLNDSDLTAAWSGAANASESTLTGLSLPGSVTPTTIARGIQSSRMPGVPKSLRQIPLYSIRGSAYTEMASAASPRGLVAGQTYTSVVDFYQARAQGFTVAAASRAIVLTGTTGGYNTSVLAEDIPGTQRVRLTYTIPPTGDWYLRLYNGGMLGDPSTWWNNFTTVAGVYTGDPITGDMSATDTERYSWAGAAGASNSILETRDPIDRPQTDLEYMATVDPYRRFMHSVGVTSGPIVVEERRSGNSLFNVLTVEFTVTAERPWTYSTARPVELPTTATALIQDVPYNLFSYPSAEISSGAVVLATNFSTNPSAETNATGWVADRLGSSSSTMVGSRVTNELRAEGVASFRGLFSAVLTAFGGTDFWVEQTVNISTRPAGSRVSINMWTALTVVSGTNGGYTAPTITAYWLDAAGGNILRTDELGTVDGVAMSGAISAKSLVPPVGATHVRVRSQSRVTNPSADTVIRIYADALAVTAP